MPNKLQNTNLPPRGSKMAKGVCGKGSGPSWLRIFGPPSPQKLTYQIQPFGATVLGPTHWLGAADKRVKVTMLGWCSPTNLRMVTQRRKCTDMEFGTYTLLTKLTLGDNCHGKSPSIHRMVIHKPKDGYQPTLGWSPTRRKCTTDVEFGT